MTNCKLLFKTMLVLAAFSIAQNTAHAFTVLYNQTTNDDGGAASQNAPPSHPNYATVYDNFTLGSTSDIASVSWVGSFFNPGTHATITGFTLTFYADNAGAPGSMLYSTAIAGNADETFIKTDLERDPEYAYDAAVTFQAAGGTTYWLSIVPDMNFPPQWAWEYGTGGDSKSLQILFGGPNPLTADEAFTLNGSLSSVTPEPSSLVLLSTSLLGALGMFRRRLARP